MIKVLGDRVLVKPIVQDKTKGGLIIPDTAQANVPNMQGVVKDIGPGRFSQNGWVVEPRLSIGDTISFMPVFSEIEDGDEKYYVISLSSIVCVHKE